MTAIIERPVATASETAAAPEAPPKSRKRRALSLLGWLAVLAIVVVAWPVRFGGHLGLTVVSGQSMAGTYSTGDLVATWRTGAYAEGDVIVYRIPEGGTGEGLRVIHRVIDQRADGTYRTQGDNQDFADPWLPTEEDIDGQVVAMIPAAGTLLTWLLSPLAFVLVAATCLAVWVYRLVAGD